ncbi:sulfate adenylyltransferase subunit 2, partial [Akkermansiaceae bacterium]|nr:sulfate adenylyltransferase subunit 2 [Akkermansiaceae bacterium]
HLARKAFYPARIPFPLVHVDTGHNFPETIAFRDAYAEKIGARLFVGSVQDSIDKGTAVEETGANASRNKLQTVTLLETIEEQQYDAVLGGGRRDEEKARAKERFFSHRNDFGEWDPKNQRPELWNLFNGRKQSGEHFRVFPLSNFTEMDVWMYMHREGIELPSLYYAHERETVKRNGVILSVSEFVQPREGETVEVKKIRFRTMGDATITGAVESSADTMEKIIEEVAAARQTERGNRADDKRSETAMEDRKKEGYF